MAGEPLVRNASFDIGRGEAVALIPGIHEDPSPLLDVLAGLLSPESGEISWNGISSKEIERSSAGARYRLEREVRLEVGYATPAASLFNNQTLFDNIALPLRYHLHLDEDEVCSRVEDAIRGLRLEGQALRRPSEVPRSIRRRAELARALVLDPALLVVDSPYFDGDRPAAQALGSFLEARLGSRSLALIAAVEDPARIRGLFTRALLVDGGSLKECRGDAACSLSDAVERRMQRGTEIDNAKEDT